MRVLVIIYFTFISQNIFANSKLNNEFNFEFENDSLMQTDKYYSSGLKLMYKRSIINGRGGRLRLRLGYSQEIYTPDDTSSANVTDGDHPYTGLQYGILGLSYANSSFYLRADVWRGVQGERSKADEIQNFVHKVTPSEGVNGWDNQTGEQVFWNSDFMLVKRNTLSLFEFSPWAKLKTGDLRYEIEPGVKFGINAGIIELFTNVSGVFVKYNAILQGPKGVESTYVITEDKMEDIYYKADAGVILNFRKTSLLLKSTWTSSQFEGADSHLYATLKLFFFW